jgi:Arc/MetJ family transcription regulator
MWGWGVGITRSLNDAILDAREVNMRTTVTLDDSLVKEARELSGLKETGPLLKAALQALIYRESALRLARLGGTQPDLQDIPRRRWPED